MLVKTCSINFIQINKIISNYHLATVDLELNKTYPATHC